MTKKLQALGGWLILVGFGLIANLLVRSVTLARSWEGLFPIAAWRAAAVPGGRRFHPL